MRYFLSFVIFILMTGCSHKKKTTGETEENSGNLMPAIITKDYLLVLKQRKKIIDGLAKDTDKVIVLVKIPNEEKLRRVFKGKFPDEVEITYNLLLGKERQIVCAMEAPFSESGDWDITYKSYFDNNGRLFAFERDAGFFNSECTKDDDAAHEVLVKFFDTDKKLVDSAYTLTDSHKRPLVKAKCTFNYNYPYQIIYSWGDYKKANKIEGY